MEKCYLDSREQLSTLNELYNFGWEVIEWYPDNSALLIRG